MAVDVSETEIKYDSPQGAILPKFDKLPQIAGTRGPEVEQLEAEYYDTIDLRLIRAGITLRRRRGGHDEGWHLKLPAGADTRREIQLPLGSEDSGVPREFAELVRVHTRAEPVRLVALLTTVRQRLVLVDKAGQSLAEVAADNVRAKRLVDGAEATSWDEVEVELTGGDRALLEAAGDLLRRGGLRPAGHAAKLERALGIRREAPGPRPALTASSPAGEVVRAYLGAQVEILKALDPMVRRDEPDAVHQMRVATRRLRSTLQSFRKIIGGADTDQLIAELRWLGVLLGEARDLEVLGGHLLASLDKTPAEQVIGPVRARVRGHFAPARAAALAAITEALDSPRYFALLDRLDRLMAEPASGARARKPAGQMLPAAVRRAYRRTSRRMKTALAAPPGHARDAALHEARKAAKRARYAAEALALAMGEDAERFAGQMKNVQSLLGDHQDSVIARQVERELGIRAYLDGENAFTYGLLYGCDAGTGEQLQEQARKTWRQASRSRYRRWLR